jgi:hypothetical protein
MFAPGRLTALSFDVDSKRFEARGTSDGKGRPHLRVIVPLRRQYGGRKNVIVQTSGLRKVALGVRKDGVAVLTGRAGTGDWRVVLTKK